MEDRDMILTFKDFKEYEAIEMNKFIGFWLLDTRTREIKIRKWRLE